MGYGYYETTKNEENVILIKRNEILLETLKELYNLKAIDKDTYVNELLWIKKELKDIGD